MEKVCEADEEEEGAAAAAAEEEEENMKKRKMCWHRKCDTYIAYINSNVLRDERVKCDRSSVGMGVFFLLNSSLFLSVNEMN